MSDDVRRIVSSDHLVSERAAELSEFEFGLIICFNAFSRWTIRCMAAAGYPEMSALEVLTLHSVNHKTREKRLSDLCFVLNVEDTHTVNYALKKLEARGLVARTKKGKEALFSATEEGAAACAKYREVRESCLVDSFGRAGENSEAVGEMASQLRALSGLYGQGARAATVL
jgi:predicted MarR family transcription regulator